MKSGPFTTDGRMKAIEREGEGWGIDRRRRLRRRGVYDRSLEDGGGSKR